MSQTKNISVSHSHSPHSSRSHTTTTNNAGRSSPSNSSSTSTLGNLSRFHPAIIYQSQSHQPHSHSRHHNPRGASPNTTSLEALRHYRELIESASLSSSYSTQSGYGHLSLIGGDGGGDGGGGPSAPRLNPLRSPGPVTPLTLEESSNYLAVGAGAGGEMGHQNNHDS